MRIKIIDVDIHHLNQINGLAEYDAVEILFRDGREPVGRSRVACESGFLNLEKIKPFIRDLPAPSPLYPKDENLQTVSVAICTRNRPKVLTAALHSLTSQKYPTDQIIVVDNGCQNEVRDLVKSILPDATYIIERCPGLDFARNRALSIATGDIIAFLDDDAEADPYWTRSISECFTMFPKAAAVIGLILPLELETRAQNLFEANGGFARGFKRRILPHDERRLFRIRLPVIAESIGVGSGCNMAFNTSVLKQLNGFDNALDTGPSLPGGGDLDIIYRVMRAGYELIYEPRAFVRHQHRCTEDEISSQLAGHHKSLIAFLVKTFGVEHGITKAEVLLFLIWRLIKPGLRLILCLLGQDKLPLTFLLRIFVASFKGLGSYQASRRRIEKLLRQNV